MPHRAGICRLWHTNLRELRQGEVVRKRHFLSTSRVQRGEEQGRVQGNPTSNSGKEKEPLGK
jgi:hypothetical protein